MKKLKKLFSMLLVASMLMAMFPAGAFGENEIVLGNEAVTYALKEPLGGEIDNLNWTLDTNGVLTISGEGDMKDFFMPAPWGAYGRAQHVTSVVVEDGVTSIGLRAFADCFNLTTVTIADSVTKLGSDVFVNCVLLTGIDLPDNLTSIGSSAFSGCTALEAITIPDTVTEIGQYAFFECAKLTTIVLPTGVTVISANTFEECTGLKTVAFSPLVTEIGAYAFKNCAIENVALFFGLTSIGNSAFEGCKKLTSVKIPKSVLTIGGKAFYGCNKLTSVNIPAEVETIGPGAFSACAALEWIYVDEENEDYSSKDGVLFNKDESVLICHPAGMGNESYTLPKSVVKIEENAFEGCAGLAEIKISKNVSAIGSYAFSDCSKLETVYYEGNPKQWNEISVGDNNAPLFKNTPVFYHTYEYEPPTKVEIAIIAMGTCGENLTWSLAGNGVLTIYGEGEMDDFDTDDQPWYDYKNQITAVVIEDGVTSVGDDAFFDCTKITSVEIADSVMTIGNTAFLGCRGLTGVEISSNVMSIGHQAFAYCTKVVNFYVDSNNECYCSVDGVLFDKDMIELIQYPAANTRTTYTTPSTMKRIGASAFVSCYSLTSVAISSGVTFIEDIAFSDCRNLESITIPVSVTYIGPMAFYYCTGLTTVYYDGTEAQWNAIEIAEQNDSLLNAEIIFAVEDNCAEIVSNPKSVTAQVGETVKFTVKATGDGLTYCWQYKTASGSKWNNSTAADSKTDTLTVSATMQRNGYQYRCVVTDQYGNKVTSKAATLTVANYAKIVSEPADITVNLAEENTAIFTVKAEGDGLTYCWQYKTASGSKWNNSTAADSKTDTLTITATKQRNGYQYRCVVTDKYGNEVISKAATLTVIEENYAEIVSDPKDITVNLAEENTAIFTVKAEGDGLTYCWQYKTASGSKWNNSTAADSKTATLTVTATKQRNGYQYRCVVTDKYGNEVISKAATLTVIEEHYAKIVSEPKDITAQVGETVKFTIVASGDGLTYRWQYKEPGSTWRNSGSVDSRTDTLTVNAATSRNGYQYRCIIVDQYGNVIWSTEVTLTVVKKIKIVTDPVSISAQKGKMVSFTVVATGDGLKYQWQYKTPGGKWNDSTSSTSRTDTLLVEAATHRDGYQYRCIVTDQYGYTVTSEAATLTVGKENFAEIVSDPADITAEKGETVKFTVKATGDGLTYRWQYKLPGGSWNDTTTSSGKTDTLLVEAATHRNNYQYRCLVTDKYGYTVASEAARLLVVERAKITADPTDVIARKGQLVTFAVAATGDGVTYCWQYKQPGRDWKNTSVSTSKTDTLLITADAYRDGYQYRCVVTDKYGNEVTTKAATLTVIEENYAEIVSNPKSVTAQVGETVKFTVKATGDGLTYRWQYKTPGGTSWNNSSAADSKTDTLSVTAAAYRDGYQYRCVVTDKYGNEVRTIAVTLKVID